MVDRVPIRHFISTLTCLINTGSFFLGQGPVQGPREEVQGLGARATKRCARASGFSKILNSLAPLVVALAPNYTVYH